MKIINADHLKSILQEYVKREESYIAIGNNPIVAKGVRTGLKEAITQIDSEPSVQSGSCEYYALCRHGRDENKLREDLGFCEYCNEDADGYVKPIEKNGHAFIRFGMNGWELSLKATGWHGSAKIKYCPMCGRDLYVKREDGEQYG